MYGLTPLNMRTKRDFPASIKQRAAILTNREVETLMSKRKKRT